MRRLAAAAVLACLVLLASGCGDEPSTGPSAADYKAERERLIAQMKASKKSAPTAPRAAPEGEPMESGFGAMASSYSYDKKGKRDPFRPYRHDANQLRGPKTPLMAYELEQLSVVALVWETNNPRALVSDPRGDIHVVKEGSPIGKNEGLVIHIGDNIVLVKETYVDFAGEMTTKDVELTIRRSQGG